MYRFMQGRYGLDRLSQVMMIGGLVILVIASFVRRPVIVSNIIYLAGIVIVILGYVRVFSRNIQKRYRENEKFMSLTAGIRRLFSKEKYMMKQRKDYRIFTCPGCKQKIRIPKGKGKIEITCPKCRTKFIKKT
ncbi:hypothetical protein HNP82_001711 [Catenibacillus scindens]|uniref:Zn-finger containing protein n=1 Tax=Catenibacillus scindens TaxID=673271 RepID=A0A7W8H9W3_9FIRM|nr:hypothetical protein [Catenibacillus scindens]